MTRTTEIVIATAAAVACSVAVAAALRRALLGPLSPQEFSLSCACGRVKADVRAPAPLHLVCHCDDCQNYTSWAAAQRPAASAREPLPPPAAPDASGGVRTVQVWA